MEKTREVDYLIVGQGIAGSMLSHFLTKRNKTVFVIDNYYAGSSSNVAAGLFNPITGRRIVKTWKADELLPFAQTTYQELELQLKETFYHKKNIFKVFTSIKEQNDWLSKSEAPEFKNYVLAENNFKLDCAYLPQPFGGFEITNSGYIDIALFLKSYKNWLLERELSSNEQLDYRDLTISETTIEWKNLTAKKIIFCEGYKAIENPWFNYLPFVLTKGELLTIYAKELDLEKIISKGIFILPHGENKFKAGSTYSWNEADEIPTEKGKSDLIEKLANVITSPYEIIEHKAGVRPTVKDRRPFIGIHSDYKNVGIFNGMGTKGASLAPFFADHFVDHLEDGSGLDKEVDIARFRE